MRNVGRGILTNQTAAFIGLPQPVMEYRFHPTRKWRFDYAWPSHMVALEVEGGHWIGGRHTRGAGFAADLEKYNEAALSGWMVLRVTTEMITSGKAWMLAKRALGQYR